MNKIPDLFQKNTLFQASKGKRLPVDVMPGSKNAAINTDC